MYKSKELGGVGSGAAQEQHIIDILISYHSLLVLVHVSVSPFHSQLQQGVAARGRGLFFCFLSFLGGVGGGRLTCFAGSLAAKTLYAIEGGGGE